jgi:hypothetical protein
MPVWAFIGSSNIAPALIACSTKAGRLPSDCGDKKSGRIAPSACVRVNFDVKRFG